VGDWQVPEQEQEKQFSRPGAFCLTQCSTSFKKGLPLLRRLTLVGGWYQQQLPHPLIA
jgi:hypothetical protein